MIDALLGYLDHPFLLYTLLGVVLSTSSTAIIGNFWFLQKKSLVSDAIAHALLPGLCIGFLCMKGGGHPVYLTLGALATGGMGLFLLDQIHTHTTIKKDSAIAIVIAIFLGIGLFLLTYIQQQGGIEQAGLKLFLFGHIATLMNEDIFIFIGLAITVIILTLLFFRSFTTISFDPTFAQTIGWPIAGLKLLLQGLTILTIVSGVRAMGTLLITSILIIPAATARFWSDKLSYMIFFSILLATLSSISGTFLSYYTAELPTGPSIVLCMIVLAFFSFFMAPKSGVLARKYKRYKYQEMILTENLLKLLYEIGQEKGSHDYAKKLPALLERRAMPVKSVKRILRKLVAKGMVDRVGKDGWVLTPAGRAKGEHVLSLHKLWENYLMDYLTIKKDHVHDDAEAVEHLLTPELEDELRNLLGK